MIFILRKKLLLRVAILFLVFVVALLALVVVLRSHDTTATASDGNWGLSFQQAGQPPVGNATKEELQKVQAYYCGDTEEKVIYLTFDAGYENGHTEKILDVLKEQRVPAAFFVVGNYLETSPELVKRMVKEGHIVGNHTYHHPDMSQIATKEDFEKELTSLEELYEKITGQKMKKYYRPPQGKYSNSNLQMAKDMGYTTIFWSLAYVDWYQDQQPSQEEAIKTLIPRTHTGAIILLHSTSKTNADVLEQLITKWKKQGYQFKSLDQLEK